MKMTEHNDFSDSDYIGRRYGNLEIIGYAHGTFITRCDCGFEKPVKCSAIINGKTSTCGRVECEYHVSNMKHFGKDGALVAQIGAKTEKEIHSLLESYGYTVESTPFSDDFGVDLICVGRKGERVAIQVKNNYSTHSKANVHAVQEVYAGGKYYDCDKFAVVSYTGYTDNAKKMADKLGVFLCNEKCELINEKEHYHINTKYFWIVDGEKEAMTETFKKNGWDFKKIGRFVGMSYEQVKQHFNDVAKKHRNVQQRKESGFIQQTIAYRMKHMGMTFEQAISEPKHQMGRPKKEKTA